MQYGVILNSIYNTWINSTFFSILERIWSPLKRAYDNLAAVRFLRGYDRVQAVYEGSLFSRIIRFILDLIYKLIAAIAGFIAPAWESSLIVRLCRGSFILNFEFLLGGFICVMFITPHESWNNAYAVIAALGFLALYLILAGSGKRELMYPDRLGLPLALFAIALIVSLLFTHDLSDSIRILLFFIAAFIFTYVIAADITDEKLGENHVYFLPYLMGERSPINDTNARGTFTGMTMDTSRADLVQAVLEGVAFAIRDSFEVAKSLGIAIPRSNVCGGGAKSPLWRRIFANVLGIPLDMVKTEQGPGYGAAMLAMVGCGKFASVQEAADALVETASTTEPDAALTAKYEARYQNFKKLYPALKGFFAATV